MLQEFVKNLDDHGYGPESEDEAGPYDRHNEDMGSFAIELQVIEHYWKDIQGIVENRLDNIKAERREDRRRRLRWSDDVPDILTPQMIESSSHYRNIARIIERQEQMIFLFNHKHFVDDTHKAEVCQDAYDDPSEMLERQDLEAHYDAMASLGRVNPNNMFTRHLVKCRNYTTEEETQRILGLIHLGRQHEAKTKREMESSDDEKEMSDDNSIGDPNDPSDMRNRVIFFSD